MDNLHKLIARAVALSTHRHKFDEKHAEGDDTGGFLLIIEDQIASLPFGGSAEESRHYRTMALKAAKQLQRNPDQLVVVGQDQEGLAIEYGGVIISYYGWSSPWNALFVLLIAIDDEDDIKGLHELAVKAGIKDDFQHLIHALAFQTLTSFK